MLRFTLLFLLPLVINVTGQGSNNQPIRRSRPIPVLGRLRSVRPIQSASPSPQPPVVASTPLPVTAATQPAQSVSAPQVIIQVVSDTPTSVATTTAPAAVTHLQPLVVPPQLPVGPTASTDIQPPLAAVSSSHQPEVPVVPVEPEEELATYEPKPESEPELKLETEIKPEPDLEPELQTEPAAQPVSALAAQPVSELAAQPVSDLAAQPLPDQAPQYKPVIRPQMNIVAVPQSASKPVAFKPAPSALPPLLPKPQPVREPVFGRQTRPTTQNPITVSTQRVTKTPPVIITTSTTQRPGSLKQDLVCKDGNGYYAVDNECDSYIECKYNKATQRWCPDGLHFNPAAKRYEYPCAYPSVVKCNARNERQNPNSTAQCPRQYGFFSTNDGDCSKYVVCQEGAATIMDCPSGLVFNPTVQSCDWVENVPQCNPNVFKDYVCPEPPIGEDGLVSDIIYKYRYEQQCKLYIACHRGHPRLLSCDHGLSFHEDSQSCIEEEYVLDCATPRS